MRGAFQSPHGLGARGGGTMRSETIEFQRFGDPTGILRLSDRYIRTVGQTRTAQEVGIDLPQDRLSDAMATFDYGHFGRANHGALVARAEDVLDQLAPIFAAFLDVASIGKVGRQERCQVDIATRLSELSQLPFEVLEESDPRWIITRRVRQPWPPPPVVASNRPKVLFAWAEPRVDRSSGRMTVPHSEHRDVLAEILTPWGSLLKADEMKQAARVGQQVAGVELANASFESLAAWLGDPSHGFTHLHLLAHGVGPARERQGQVLKLDLKALSPPCTYVALEDAQGVMRRCSDDDLSSLFVEGVPRPQSAVIATCGGGEVLSAKSGGSLAHAVHAAGVPIVLASQLALTKTGSRELANVFYRRLVAGEDPRQALHACRNKLRKDKARTYYDRIALVGYMHLEPNLEVRLQERRFKVAMDRLRSLSRRAATRVGQLSEGDNAARAAEAALNEVSRDFEQVRQGFDTQAKEHLTKPQREEMQGIQASAFKREAEACWQLCQALEGAERDTYLQLSHERLNEARQAYRGAAKVSLDGHWTAVQWLVLEAVHRGRIEDLKTDWLIAMRAASDAAGERSGARITAKDRGWAFGSLVELHLLAPLVGAGTGLAQAQSALTKQINVAKQTSDQELLTSAEDQLTRYVTWWGKDNHWQLCEATIGDAGQLIQQISRAR